MKDLDITHGLSPTGSASNHSPSSDPDSDHDFEEHDSLLDPFEVESDEDGSSNDGNLLQNTQDNSGPDRSEALLRAKIPLNPFPSVSPSDRGGSSMFNEKHTIEIHKPTARHYDVDSFTRLLMTGKGDPPRKSTSNGETYEPNITNAISFAPIPAIPGPQPNNAQYILQDSHGFSSNDERRGMVSKSNVGIYNMRPAASQFPHEKTSERASPKTNVSHGLPYPTPGSPVSPIEPTSSSTPNSPVNLNKPLPPPPTSSRPQTLPSHEGGVSADVNTREKVLSNQADPSDSTLPLPLVSRYSSFPRPNSLVVTQERPASGSVNRTEELQATSINLPPPSPKQPPPPLPPPRRQGRARGISASSTSSAISGASASNTPFSADDFASKPFKPQPPARTPSNSSMTRPTRRSTHPDSPSTIPPPVPPQRRNSSRSSYNKAGTSTQHQPGRQNSDLWALWASNPDEAVPGQKNPESDVLAGLSELQREVDELRGKIHG